MNKATSVDNTVYASPSYSDYDKSPKLSPSGTGYYSSIVVSSQHLAMKTTPDMNFAANTLAFNVKSPTQLRMLAAQRVSSYLTGTADLVMNMHPGKKDQVAAFVIASFEANSKKSKTADLV